MAKAKPKKKAKKPQPELGGLRTLKQVQDRYWVVGRCTQPPFKAHTDLHNLLNWIEWSRSFKGGAPA